MNAWLVFAAFAVVAGIWTVAWIWIVTHAHSPAPSKAGEEFDLARARRILLPLLGAAAIGLFVTSLPRLPYPHARVRRLGVPVAHVAVTGVQWTWQLGRDTLPAGVPVEFAVTSRDVNHGFAIYDSAGRLLTQVQAMPDYTNRLVYTFPAPGSYVIRCLEYCGIAHHVMQTTLVVTGAAGTHR
ncbi:MAG: cytochrome c oxidase subunit II [Gemmatimonadetes bacterium]|nr:MAG: cytochrome c oxidase subunit II [Gemmatimonadota bacterium]